MCLRPTDLPPPKSRCMPGVVLRGSVAGLLGWLISLGAAAQGTDATAYRCGNSYSSKPCPGGTAVDVADPRSAGQQREAREASQRQAALARQMKADRLADERAAPKGGAANLGPSAAHPPAKAASKPHATRHNKAHKPAKSAKPASAPR